MNKDLYRLYIDESGTHHYSKLNDIGKRFLGLTGVIIRSDHYESDFQPRILKIKKLFSTDLDDLPILHREDIVNKNGPFFKLRDTTVEKKFNKLLFDLLKNANYSVCAVVLDKKSHLERYQKSAEHPYHYCLKVMLERYLHFLEIRGKGDVMAESRGRFEDMELKRVYRNYYKQGSHFSTKEYVQSFLTSKELKIKKKDKGIFGLEIADLLSLATKLDVLSTNKLIAPLKTNFNKKITTKLQPKYCRGNNSRSIKGYGKKML